MCPSGFKILEDFKLTKANKTAGIQKDGSDFAGTDGRHNEYVSSL